MRAFSKSIEETMVMTPLSFVIAILNGTLVYFAAWKNHIGFYPTFSGMNAFKEELSEYKGTKDSIHFPLTKPLPNELISKIVKFRVAENKKKAQEKIK